MAWGCPKPLAGAPSDTFTQLLAHSHLLGSLLRICRPAHPPLGLSWPGIKVHVLVGKYYTERFRVTMPGVGS